MNQGNPARLELVWGFLAQMQLCGQFPGNNLFPYLGLSVSLGTPSLFPNSGDQFLLRFLRLEFSG